MVNLGDALRVQTNDQYRAAVHRVIPMKEKVRYSTPFFYQPRFDATIIGEDNIQITCYRIDQVA